MLFSVREESPYFRGRTDSQAQITRFAEMDQAEPGLPRLIDLLEHGAAKADVLAEQLDGRLVVRPARELQRAALGVLFGREVGRQLELRTPLSRRGNPAQDLTWSGHTSSRSLGVT